MKWQIPLGRNLQPTNDNDQDAHAEQDLIAFCEEHFPNRAQAQAHIVSQSIALEVSRQQIRHILGSAAHFFAWVRPIVLLTLFVSSYFVFLATPDFPEAKAFALGILIAATGLWLLVEQFEKILGKLVLRGGNPFDAEQWRFETGPKMRRVYREAHRKVHDKRIQALF